MIIFENTKKNYQFPDSFFNDTLKISGKIVHYTSIAFMIQHSSPLTYFLALS